VAEAVVVVVVVGLESLDTETLTLTTDI